MPINVFFNSSNDNENNKKTNLFVQKPYLRTKYLETKIEEDIDMKNQFRIENLKDLISIREATSKSCVDNHSNDPSIKKTAPILILMIKI